MAVDGMQTKQNRPLRAVSTMAVIAAACATLSLISLVLNSAFCGVTREPHAAAPPMGSVVAMRTKSRDRQGGIPNLKEMARRKAQFPSLNNIKDQYFILWARSKKVKNWYPVNIISGSEAAKNIKSATDNDIAKAVSLDRLANYQVERALGLNLYKQGDEALKQAKKMHKMLNYAQEIQWGYKEIGNNTEFNKNPGPFLALVNISVIPPEEELRNVLDDAADAASGVGDNFAKATDQVKGFFGGR